MMPQFKARIILFSQIKKWGHWQIGETDFISLGPASGDQGLCWGLLEESGKKINLKIINAGLPAGG
jgi:hypothetical protein